MTIPEGVTRIGCSAFENCKRLSCVTVPDSVTSIGKEVFLGCTCLHSIAIPAGITSIDKEAFRGCTMLASVTFGGSRSSWKSISFGVDWNCNTGNYTVICKNGTLTKSKS